MSEYPWFDFDRVDYVTADTHFSHARISELADRPFTTVNEMNTAAGTRRSPRQMWCYISGMSRSGRSRNRSPSPRS